MYDLIDMQHYMGNIRTIADMLLAMNDDAKLSIDTLRGIGIIISENLSEIEGCIVNVQEELDGE